MGPSLTQGTPELRHSARHARTQRGDSLTKQQVGPRQTPSRPAPRSQSPGPQNRERVDVSLRGLSQRPEPTGTSRARTLRA